MKMRWMMMACLSLLGATACDLPDKNIGDETQGDSVDPGGDCTPGDVMPADDGCNTCECLDDGTWACTLIGCDPTAGTGETGDPTGGECEPGDEMLADDGCNTCQCLDDGTWACTLLACEPECEPGTTVPAPDGCNTCECLDDGTIGGCTEIACEPPADTDPFDGPELSSCEPATPFDALTIQGGTIEGDTLTLDVAYSGCGPGHPLGGCWNGEFLESFPVQVAIDVAHDDLDEVCDAFPSDTVDIDLTPLRESYQAVYEASGTIMINVAGLDGAVAYSF